MDKQTCNGWKNRATWNAHLWLSNDEPLYRGAREVTARGQIGDAADRLRDFCFDAWPSRKTPDGHNLFDVDWRDVARAFRE